MSYLKAKTSLNLAMALLVGLAVPACAVEDLFITEFMAANTGELVDEDGDTSDWVEIHNSGTNTVNLLGWYLTDQVSDLTQWRFPSTNLAANGYLIVFASGKDRRVPGAPLHTSFQLKSNGEYLALVKPDGSTVVSAYAPAFPAQADGVSYGMPAQQTVTALIATGAMARVLVPANGGLGSVWTAAMFDHSSWMNLRTGVGFETDSAGAFVPVVVANSTAEFSGVQGQANWHYGYWDRKNDANGVYSDSEFVSFPNASGAGFSASNFWTGALWDWFAGDPPLTQLSADGGRPAGQNGISVRDSHWAVRRYLSEVAGAITITGRVVHTSDWVYVTASGVAADSFAYIFMTGRGEGYIDDIKLVAGGVPEVGANLLPNGDFESGNLTPWTVASVLSGSAITTAVKHSGTRSLRIVSTGAGAQNASIKQTISPSLANGQTYTLSYWYLPATNSSSLVVQTKSRWINTTPVLCGDGVTARIFVDGAPVYQQPVFVSATNYSLTVPVVAGSRVDFAIDPGAASSDACDAAIFTAAIQTAPTPAAVVADSVADWSLTGTQGENNWTYGYYSQTGDALAGYQLGDFNQFPHFPVPAGPANYWDGSAWDPWDGTGVLDEIGERTMQPNGSNSGWIHWVIRRWRSEVSGTINVDWTLLKQSPEGGGVTVRVFQNGAQKDVVTVSASSITANTRSIVITNVQVGDDIDLALDPLGSAGDTTDTGDRSFLSAIIRGTPNLTAQVASSLQGSMLNVNATAYLRIPFVVADPSAVEFLTLRMKYDDGFLAYLNGQLVASDNAPMLPAWNSIATAARNDAEASLFKEFNISAARGGLMAGTNVLAIQGLNLNAADGDFLILPELTASSVTLDPLTHLYFSQSTPGAINGQGTIFPGPLIISAGHSPNVPKDFEDIQVTAHVQQTFYPFSTVRLISRTMFGSEVNVAMFDDGQHGDGGAGDRIYGASISAAASAPGEMVRYYIYTTDIYSNSTRFPPYLDSLNSPQYLGTVVFNPGLTNPLPVLHQFVQNPVLATNFTGTRCSIFFDGEFYDNVFVNLHGQTTASVFDKRSVNIDFNSSHQFRWRDGARRVHDINVISTAPDKAHMRHVMAYETFAAAGVPSHYAFPVRMQQNNTFHAVMHVIENGDDDFLRRLNMDPDGALYKVYLPLTSGYGGVAEKKTRKWEGNGDLQALIDGCALPVSQRYAYLYDNIDIPEVINFLAAIQIVQNEDCCDHKNYYLYRDSAGTGEWQMLPWDLDLTFGRVFTSWVFANGRWQGGYYDTNVHWNNLYYTQERNNFNYIGVDNPLVNALWSIPEIFNMFMRRWSTVQEELLQPTNTHPLRLKFERRVDELAAQIGPDATLDLAKWGTFLPIQTLAQESSILKTQYFAPRRGWIFDTLRYVNGGPYLGTQANNVVLRFTYVESNPASGNQAEEYVQIFNPNTFAVDISGWKLVGAIDYTFRGGVVIPGLTSLYVSPDVKAFRARTTGPGGGQGLFVQGNYKGQLSARGESLQLTDSMARVHASTNYAGNPSPAQQYLRVTEMMYHPAPPPPGLSTNADEFEFIEVRNTGPTSLSLQGVRFTGGVEFSFSGSAVTSLGAGASTLVVRSPAAFTSRYGVATNLAGQYSGSLDNMGEAIRLEDAVGERILDFAYNNAWYPITDGVGFSLVIVNDAAPWDTWGLKPSWQPGGSVGGTPGQTNGSPAVVPGILITEALTHSVPPALDQIELHNPTAVPVNVNGWYLSDDFATPAKFRIQGRPPLAPGGYFVFDETAFNATPGAPESFSLSSKGDEVYLFSADTNGNLTGYYHGFELGAAEAGVSFGRHTNSVGQTHFVAQTNATFGAANTGPLVGPIVFSEIYYRPPDLADASDNSADEFIELQSISSGPVKLFDLLVSTNTWQIRGDVEFDFPTNISLGADAFIIVANIDPADPVALATFRTRNAVSSGVPIFGPYRGKLDNSSGSIRLLKPDSPSSGEVPYVLVDRVDYSDSAPWPTVADGTGASLQRSNPQRYGNDPVNWMTAAPSVGRPVDGATAPAITQQPISQVAIASGSPMFNVGAVGTGPLRYQWRFNGINLPGATTAALVVSNVLAKDAGSYQVVVFNPAGAVASSNVLLTVLYGAYFTKQPTNIAVVPGANATFTALAAGTAPVRYQWRFNNTNLAGATNASLTVSNVQSPLTGYYQVVATDSTGSLPSAPVLLSVLGPPVITAQPQGVIVTNRDAAWFTVTATGTASLKYRWRLNGVALPGEVNPSLAIASAQATNAGNYTVVVSNSIGTATSLVATLTVLVPPTITTQPQNVTVTNGAVAVFTVQSSGAVPLYYQWRRNSGNLPGETNGTLTISNSLASHAGGYSVTVGNSVGTVTSVVATLTVLVPPVITAQPQNVTVTNGAPASFSVTATGVAPLAYRWRWSGGSLTNATNATLTLLNVQTAAAGAYSAVISNSAGSITSAVATLTVLVPPSIASQPLSLTVTNGSPASFLVIATGTVPINYQWRLNATNLFGATAPALNILGAQPGNAGSYSVVLSNPAGSLTSGVAILSVLVPPGIVTHPVSQATNLGSNVTFTVVVTGTAPLEFQWRFGSTGFDDVPIPGATNISLVVTNMQTTNAGNYCVTVSNSIGSVTSVIATLTLLDGDADGDGLPDLWELAYGFNPFQVDASSDADNDGMTNFEEFVSGTEPRNPASYLKIDQVAAGIGGRLISFYAISNKTYSIQFRDAVFTGPWLKLVDVPARATNRVEVMPDPDIGVGARFYRLATPAQ